MANRQKLKQLKVRYTTLKSLRRYLKRPIINLVIPTVVNMLRNRIASLKDCLEGRLSIKSREWHILTFEMLTITYKLARLGSPIEWHNTPIRRMRTSWLDLICFRSFETKLTCAKHQNLRSRDQHKIDVNFLSSPDILCSLIIISVEAFGHFGIQSLDH
jgi:hypothetical protein